jgi:ubiquitin C-terminal hydrolase
MSDNNNNSNNNNNMEIDNEDEDEKKIQVFPLGINNQGNDCFVISLFQCLGNDSYYTGKLCTYAPSSLSYWTRSLQFYQKEQKRIASTNLYYPNKSPVAILSKQLRTTINQATDLSLPIAKTNTNGNEPQELKPIATPIMMPLTVEPLDDGDNVSMALDVKENASSCPNIILSPDEILIHQLMEEESQEHAKRVQARLQRSNEILDQIRKQLTSANNYIQEDPCEFFQKLFTLLADGTTVKQCSEHYKECQLLNPFVSSTTQICNAADCGNFCGILSDAELKLPMRHIRLLKPTKTIINANPTEEQKKTETRVKYSNNKEVQYVLREDEQYLVILKFFHFDNIEETNEYKAKMIKKQLETKAVPFDRLVEDNVMHRLLPKHQFEFRAMDDENVIRNHRVVSEITELKRGTEPERLIIQLGRFFPEYDALKGTMVCKKFENNVTVPMHYNFHLLFEQSVPNDIKYNYRLKSFIIHKGSYKGGHYIALVRNSESNQWFKCDDSTITPVTETQSQELAKQGYLFFFEHQIKAPETTAEDETDTESESEDYDSDI